MADNKAKEAVATLPPLGGTGNASQNKQNMVNIPVGSMSGFVPWSFANGVPSYIPTTAAKNSYWTMSEEDKNKLVVTMNKAYPGGWKQSDLIAGWNRAVDSSSAMMTAEGNVVHPVQMFENLIPNMAYNGLSASGSTSGSGSGGTSYAIQKSVNLTDPSTARGLIDTALNNHLGRKANAKEQAAFLKALNVQQEASPSITEQTTTSSGKSSSTTSQTTGGFNASTFANEYAAGQEGAGEFQAATSLLDSFIGALGAKV